MDPQRPLEFRASWQGQAPAELLLQAGEWLECVGRSAEALNYYRSAARLDPESSLAWFRAGRLALEVGEHDRAVADLARACALAGDHSPSLHAYGKALYALGRPEDALKAAEDVLSLSPAHPGAHLLALRALARLQRWGELSARLAVVPRDMLNSAEVRVLAAATAFKTGSADRAEELLRALGPGPRSRFAHWLAEIEGPDGPR